ncbi:hypothetical protein BV20DRAFT_1058293 [Pilatotrama ljubarskyi]|nr:hypothetical protein BV20DRAFT_1058293 [Pilatotrama ljubarskyi]
MALAFSTNIPLSILHATPRMISASASLRDKPAQCLASGIEVATPPSCRPDADKENQPTAGPSSSDTRQGGAKWGVKRKHRDSEVSSDGASVRKAARHSFTDATASSSTPLRMSAQGAATASPTTGKAARKRRTNAELEAIETKEETTCCGPEGCNTKLQNMHEARQHVKKHYQILPKDAGERSSNESAKKNGNDEPPQWKELLED